MDGEGVGDDLADAGRVGVQRIALGRLHVPQTVRLGGFDDRVPALAEPKVSSQHAAAQRIADDGRCRVCLHSAPDGVKQARAAIGHWQTVDLPVGVRLEQAVGNGVGRFVGAEAAFELLRRNEHAHH